MRGIVVVGIALIVLGVVALAWQGITYTSKEKVVDVGPLKVEAERQKTIPVSPVVGASPSPRVSCWSSWAPGAPDHPAVEVAEGSRGVEASLIVR